MLFEVEYSSLYQTLSGISRYRNIENSSGSVSIFPNQCLVQEFLNQTPIQSCQNISTGICLAVHYMHLAWSDVQDIIRFRRRPNAQAVPFSQRVQLYI